MGNIICKNFKLLLSPKENNKQVNCISEQKVKKKYISETSLGRIVRGEPRSQRDIALPGNEVSQSFFCDKIKFNKVPQSSTEFLPELKVPFEQLHLPNRFYLEHKTRLSKNDKILYKYLQIKNKNLRNFNNSLMMRICDLLNEKQLLEYKINSLIK